jgi:hypothetical protein
VLILTGNEEHNIAKCLTSLKPLGPKVYVVDSESKDLPAGQSFRGHLKLDYDATLDRLTIIAGSAVWVLDDYIATLEDAGYRFGQPYLGIGGISTYGGTSPTDDIVPFIFDNFKSTGLTLPYGG